MKTLVKVCLISIPLLLASCGETASKKEPQISEGSSEGVVQNEQKTRNNPTYLGDIAVYRSFKDLEFLFRKDNDTTHVINFWATWCKPCIEELPYLEAVNKQYEGDKLKVILVSLDFPKQLESKLLPFIEKNQLQSEVVVLLDGKYNNWIDKVSKDWTGAIPATYIYKGDAEVFVNRPFSGEEEIIEIIESLKTPQS